MIILYREEGNIRLKTIRRRFWLNNPISPKTGEKNKKLWWWIIPLILLTVAVEFLLSGPLNDLWVTLFPFLAEPPGYNAAELFENPEQWVGAWNLLVLFTVLAVFNTFLGEEFIFRGVLLPKMEGVFGKWDWVANGVIFGVLPPASALGYSKWHSGRADICFQRETFSYKLVPHHPALRTERLYLHPDSGDGSWAGLSVLIVKGIGYYLFC